MERLQKILSRAGIASRRASERLMLDGRVTVNGQTVLELGTKADAAHDDIRVDGSRIRLPERHIYLLLNKPRGYVTTRSDPQKRRTVIDLIGTRDYVYPVGRLDFDSEGLLILTNDGDLAARLTHPRHEVKRVYEARVAGVPDEHDLQRLRRGIVIDGKRTERADVQLISPHASASVRHAPARPGLRRGPEDRDRSRRAQPVTRGGAAPASSPRGVEARVDGAGRKAGALLLITVHEGRNRQIRKMCDAIGHPVDRLKRVAIGPIRDDRLKVGHWRELTPAEVERLRAATAEEDHHKGHKGHIRKI